MKKTVSLIAMAAFAVLLASSCSGNKVEEQAAVWLNKAQAEADRGSYAKAAAFIDSLRSKCPEAIEARKAALKLYQEVHLKSAQQTVQQADEALRSVSVAYNQRKAEVEQLKAQGGATAKEIEELSLLRKKRDSLQTVFDVQCAKIKYIHAKMKE